MTGFTELTSMTSDAGLKYHQDQWNGTATGDILNHRRSLPTMGHVKISLVLHGKKKLKFAFCHNIFCVLLQ